MELSCVERFPKELVLGGGRLLHKNFVVLSLDLLERISHHTKEVLVRGLYDTIHIEFHNAQRPADCSDLTLEVDFLQLSLCDVGGVFNNFENGVVFLIDDRRINAPQPHLCPILPNPPDL